MVEITEIGDPYVRVINGSWGIGPDGSWIFISNLRNTVRRLKIREAETYEKVTEQVREAFRLEYIGCDIHLTFQWPDWMDMQDIFGGKTRPVTIKSDETMSIFLAMHRELEHINLYVSKVPFERVTPPDCTSATTPTAIRSKGKTHVLDELPTEPDEELTDLQRLMEEDAILRWMSSTQTSRGETSGYSSLRDTVNNDKTGDVGPRTANVEERPNLNNDKTGDVGPRTANVEERRNLNCVEVDLLATLGQTPISVEDQQSETDSDSDGCPFYDGLGIPKEPTRRECTFFGPSANYTPGPLGVGRDLRIPLQEALEAMCLNFESFNRDAAPTLDEQVEEGRGGMELAIRDVLYEGDELFVGRVFKNKQDCIVKIAVHAINRRFHFRRDRSCKKLMTLTCISNACPWRVYIVKLEDSDNYQIRSATLEHTCTLEERSLFHKQATCRVIASIMKAKYEGTTRGPRPGDLQRILLSDHSVRISYWKAWKSREVAMEGARGSAETSFTLLPAYLHVLRQANPGSLIEMKTEIDAKGAHRFKYLFLAFAASLSGFTFMRPVIVIDGAHLKGKYGGCLLTASCQDANFQVYPLAFGFVDSENDDAWEWFFGVLRTAIPDEEKLTFISDRHSSIYTGLRRVYPRASHGACILHLQRNVASMYKKKNLAFHISRAARAFRVSDFHTYFNEVTRLHPGCAQYLEAIGFSHWSRAYFLGERYNIMTSNVAESLNAVLKEARELPIISLIEFIRTTLMSWFAKRRLTSQTETTFMTPKMREIMHQNFEKSLTYSVRIVDQFEYEVQVEGSGLGGFHVNLLEKTCTCRAFDLLQYPCSHAISAAVEEGIPIQSVMAMEYSVVNWKFSYEQSIKPVPDVNSAYPLPEPIASLQLFPPRTRRPPGRPKKKRIPSKGEFGKNKRQATRCSRCTGTGHNKATCKMPI